MSIPLSDTTLSTFTANDGDNIAVQDWPLAEDQAARGMVVLVHGLGEHAGRYDRLARRLNAWGFAVRGYDQCGHGDSAGARGCLPTASRLIDDLADMVQSVRGRMPPGMPLIVLGHSMGGLVASCFSQLRQVPIEGLVLSSPAFDAGLSRFQKLLLAVLPRLAPNLVVGNGLEPAFISHDEAVVHAYVADPRVHDRISGRLARFIANTGPRIVALAPKWKVPTLLMWAGDDHLVNPRGSQAFARAAPPAVVTAKRFPGLYHEIFNEAEDQAEPVFDTLKAWLDARF